MLSVQWIVHIFSIPSNIGINICQWSYHEVFCQRSQGILPLPVHQCLQLWHTSGAGRLGGSVWECAEYGIRYIKRKVWFIFPGTYNPAWPASQSLDLSILLPLYRNIEHRHTSLMTDIWNIHKNCYSTVFTQSTVDFCLKKLLRFRCKLQLCHICYSFYLCKFWFLKFA